MVVWLLAWMEDELNVLPSKVPFFEHRVGAIEDGT